MRVDSRVGFRVLTRVTGEIVPALTAPGLSATYDTEWNPLRPGALDVTVTLANAGNVALDVAGEASAGGASAPLGFTDGAERIELLPGDSQVVTARLQGVWPLGPLTTEVTLEGSADEVTPVIVSSATTTWALPLPQLFTLAGIALIVLALVDSGRRRRRRLRAMLAEARAQGRAEGGAPDPAEAAAR